MASSPDLGTLSILPREIRDRIYSFALDLGLDTRPSNPHLNSTPPRGGGTLLRTSRRIHDEAIIVLYQVNAFIIWINQEYNDPTNFSIMECPGYSITISRNTPHRQSHPTQIQIPKNMLRHLQDVTVSVGSQTGVNEVDIITYMDQTIQGPHRPTFHPVLDRVKEVCKLLSGCDNIHKLMVNVFSNEYTPLSIELVLDPIRQLRGIQNSTCSVVQGGPNLSGAFCLKSSYMDYLSMIMSMPKGAKAPKYVPPKGECSTHHSIFEFSNPSGPEDLEDPEGYNEYGDYVDHRDPRDIYTEAFENLYPPSSLSPDGYNYSFSGDGETYIQEGWGGEIFANAPPPPGLISSMVQNMSQNMRQKMKQNMRQNTSSL